MVSDQDHRHYSNLLGHVGNVCVFFLLKPNNFYKQVLQKMFEQLRSTVNDNRKPQSKENGIPGWLRGFGDLPLFGHADAESADTTQACSMNGSLRIKHGKSVSQTGKLCSQLRF